MQAISELKLEKERMEQGELMMDTLAMAEYRHEIGSEASKKVDGLVLNKQVFTEMKRDEELCQVARMILPGHLRNTLISATVSSTIKKKEK